MHVPCQTDRFPSVPNHLPGVSRPNWPSMMKTRVPIRRHSHAVHRTNSCRTYNSAAKLASVASVAISLREMNWRCGPNPLREPRRCPASPTLIISSTQTGSFLIVCLSFRTDRTPPSAPAIACARWVSVSQSVAKSAAILAALWATGGCAMLGRHGPQVDDVTKCRELTQQGVTAKELGQWEQSEKLLERAVEASPTDTVTRRTLADVLWHRGATKEALLQMEAAVRLDGSDASMMVRDGEMLLAIGATDKALQRAEDAIRLDQKLSSAWALRGRIYWHLNQTDRALADLQRSLQYSPDNPDVLMDVAAMYRQRGQHDRCLATLHHLFDTYPPGQESQMALWMQGLTLADLGRPEQAVESLLAASRIGPPNPDLLYGLAQAQLAAGLPAAATASAQQALATNAKHEPSRQLLEQMARNPAASVIAR
jgi:tetratricopeptide (TPR) repeat protein